MAITTLNGVIAGFKPPIRFGKAATPTLTAGRPHSLFYLGGNPGAATAPTPGLSGAALTSYTGQLPFTNPSGESNAYLGKLNAQATIAGSVLICDRLWHNSGIVITSTSSQTINSVAFPARDNDGTSNGKGVLIGVEVSTATGAGTPTFTMNYTNSDGINGRVAINIQWTTSSSPVGSFFELGLQAGDLGVRSIQSFQLSATWTSGVIHLVAYRVLAEITLTGAFMPASADVFELAMPRLYSNTVPFIIFIPQTTTASQVSGNIVYTHG